MRFRQHQEDARVATRRLLLLFLLTVALTVVVVNGALALLWWLTGWMFWMLGSGWPRWFFETNTAVVLGFVLGGAWLESLQLRDGGARLAAQVGGIELLTPADERERRLRNIVDEMAIASGIRPPRVFVLPREHAINAFAAGWEQHDSVLAVTRGALDHLNRDELQGVVAHEFGHILQGDTRLNMRLVGYVYGLQMVYLLGHSLYNATDEHGKRTPLAALGLVIMVAGSAGWLAGRLLKAAVSRQREFLADASAVQYTRLTHGIGGALRKIAGQLRKGQASVQAPRMEALSHMLLVSDLYAGHPAMATHPPLAERLRRLYGRDMPAMDLAPIPMAPAGAPELPPLAFAATSHGADAPDALNLHTADAHALRAISTPAAPPAQTDWIGKLLESGWDEELQAALLAFLVAPGSPAQQQAWRQALSSTVLASTHTQGDRTPAVLLQRVWALPPAERLRGYERLLTRCAALPREQRSRLRDHGLRIVRADGPLRLPEVWRCLMLEQLLGQHRDSPLRELHARSLAQCRDAVATLTRVLARGLFGTLEAQRLQRLQWRQGVLQALSLGTDTAAQDVGSVRDLAQAVAALRQLSWLARPQLIKTWHARAIAVLPDLPDLSESGSAANHAEVEHGPHVFADALHAICVLIDTPWPAQMQSLLIRHTGAATTARQREGISPHLTRVADHPQLSTTPQETP